MEVLRSVGAKKDRERLFHILEHFILPKRKPDERKKKKKGNKMCVTVYGVISWHRVRALEREESGGDCKQAGL